MTWVAVAAGAAAVIGAGASYAGSKKQSDAAKKGSSQQLGMFNTLNAQQQPFIQSGYGAMSKINTLLGLGGHSGGAAPMGGAPGYSYQPTPNGGMRQVIPNAMPGAMPDAMNVGGGQQNMRLKQILALRAKNGDSEAARVLGSI